MAILQVHQAKALKQVHEGSTDPGLMQELRTATDFALRASKVTAQSLGKAMSTMVVQERHLWLNLAEMKDVDKARFLDAPISQGGLFSDTVEGFAQQFSAVQQQTEAIQHILPRRDAPSTAAPGARPQSARRRGRPPASSRAAPPQAESTHRPVRPASRKRAAPPASQPGPKSSRKSRKRPCSPVATPFRDDPADLESIQGSSGRPVCLPRVLPLPAVLLPDRGPPRHRRTGTQLASGLTQVCVSPIEPTRTGTVQAQGGRGADPAGCAPLAHPDLVSRTHFPRDCTSLAHSSEEGSPFSGARHHMAPASRSMEPPYVAPGRDAADLSGLPPAVVETIIQARAPSTRQTYALKWSLFATWCSSRREDPRRCTIGVVLSFLQERIGV